VTAVPAGGACALAVTTLQMTSPYPGKQPPTGRHFTDRAEDWDKALQYTGWRPSELGGFTPGRRRSRGDTDLGSNVVTGSIL